jgi:hypothetical protein
MDTNDLALVLVKKTTLKSKLYYGFAQSTGTNKCPI